MKRWSILGLAALTLPVLAACKDKSAGPTVIGGTGAIDVNLELQALGIPTAAVDATFDVIDLDTVNNPTDLFGRAAPTTDIWDSRFGGSFEIATDYGRKDMFAGRWFRVDEFGSNPDDPRLPALVQNPWAGGDDYGAAMDFIRIRSPESFAGRNYCIAPAATCWVVYQDLDQLAPDGTWVAYGFVRYGVMVNGLVDHLEIWTEGPDGVQPDELMPLPNNPGGSPEVQADNWTFQSLAGECPAVDPAANPFILGHSRLNHSAYDGSTDSGANYDGESDADFCVDPGGAVWGQNPESPTAPLATNEFESFDLPQYNYYVIWEYDKDNNQVMYDRPLLRAQIGIDLDMNGNPMPHTFAPFPFRTGHAFNPTFTSRSQFLSHRGVSPALGQITLTAEHLAPLGSGSYQIWLADATENDAARISATYVRQVQEVVGEDEFGEPIVDWVDETEPQTVDSFDGQLERRHVVTVDGRQLRAEGVPLTQFGFVVITSGDSDANPFEAPTPLWYRFADEKGTRADNYDDDTFRVGTAKVGFDPDLADRGIGWQPFGAGTIEFLATTAFGLRLNRIARPPMGYYYNVWLVHEEDGSTMNLGPVETPAPEFESLRDADIQTSTYVTDTEILSAARYVEWSEAGASWDGFTHVYVTLEPKAGDMNQMSPTLVYAAGIPGGLDELPEEDPEVINRGR